MGEPVGAGRVDETELDAIPVVLEKPTLQQMSPGEMLGSKQFAVFDGVACFREEWTRKLHGQGVAPSGYFLFACVSSPATHMDWCGRRIDATHLGFASPSSEVGFWSPDPGDHVVLLVPKGIVTSYMRDDPKHEALSGGGTIMCDPQHVRQFVERINSIVGGCLADPDALNDARTRSELREQTLVALMHCLDDASAIDHEASKGRRQEALRRALDHAEALHGMTTLPELTEIAGVARRTLELAFREGTGVTPKQYLRRRRMNAARRELRDASPGSTTVTRVATRWGFNELGRFAGEYRAMFGELPSETLAGERLVRPRVTPLSVAAKNPPRPKLDTARAQTGEDRPRHGSLRRPSRP